jgi:hypothetical protein
MSFFHNLNKTLDSIAAKPEAAQLNERDMSRAAKGHEKYGKEGMQALARAGREGKDLDKVRDKYDKYDESIEEGLGDVVKKVGGLAKKAGNAVLNKVGHGSDADMIRDLQRKMGLPQTGEKPQQPKEGNEFSGELQQARATGQKEFSVDGKEYPVKEAGMTPKQKSFAALAEPRDKVTFADKIAGAKQEVDEMLGDVAAEAMKDAIGKMGAKSHQARTTMKHIPNAGPALKKAAKDIKPGVAGYRDRVDMLKAGGVKGAPGEVEEDDDNNPFTNWKKPRRDTPRTGEVTHGAKHDTEWTATGRKVTRRVDPQGMSVGSDTDAEGNAVEKRGRGRPKGPAKGPERTTAKAYKHKGERKVKEGEVSTGNLQKMHQLVTGLKSYIQDEDGQAALKELTALIKHYTSQGSEQELDEKAVSKKQQKFMGMVHAAQKGEKPASKEVAKTAKSMGKKDAEDFASTKHKGLPEKKKSEAKENKSTDSDSDSKEDAPKKSKSKFKFGGSVYEALDAQLETLITEGMSVTVNMSQDAEHGEDRKNITVNADGEDAEQLAELLQMAGMSQQSSSCSSCGSSPCGCDMIDENSPNWPTDSETNDNALQYAGGLNGPKSTGQATTPVLASQLRRQVSMEQNAKVEQNLLNLYRTFGK